MGHGLQLKSATPNEACHASQPAAIEPALSAACANAPRSPDFQNRCVASLPVRTEVNQRSSPTTGAAAAAALQVAFAAMSGQCIVGSSTGLTPVGNLQVLPLLPQYKIKRPSVMEA